MGRHAQGTNGVNVPYLNAVFRCGCPTRGVDYCTLCRYSLRRQCINSFGCVPNRNRRSLHTSKSAAGLAMEDDDRAPLAEDAARAVDSVGDKHTRFEAEP